jgi:hypothetical protein
MKWIVVTCKIESLLDPEKIEFVPDENDYHGQARDPILYITRALHDSQERIRSQGLERALFDT